MGKTSVSLAVTERPLIKERFPGGNVVWVPCIEATSATLLLEILSIQLQVPEDKQVSLEKIIFELDTLKQPRLIVVDNFETPWNGNQKQVGDILRRLAMLSHIAILVTMRGRRPPCYGAIEWQTKDIESTDEESCLRIYHDINSDSKTTRMSLNYCLHWGVCLSQSHLWRIWEQKPGRALKTCWTHGPNQDLTYCRTILKGA